MAEEKSLTSIVNGAKLTFGGLNAEGLAAVMLVGLMICLSLRTQA